MGNPLDTISGTITAGFVLTAVLYVLVKALVEGFTANQMAHTTPLFIHLTETRDLLWKVY